MVRRTLVVAVDFDGTCVDHRYPEVGTDVPGAATALSLIAQYGARIILYTMRSDNDQHGAVLANAVEWFADRDIPLWGVNQNPEQYQWTRSPKVYAHVYVDDAAFGCPLIDLPGFARPVVDWAVVGPAICQRIEREAIAAIPVI